MRAYRMSVSCCRRLLASLLTSLLGYGVRSSWLLLLLAAEAAPVMLRPPQVMCELACSLDTPHESHATLEI